MPNKRTSEYYSLEDDAYVVTRNRRHAIDRSSDGLGNRRGTATRRKSRAVCRKSTPKSSLSHFAEKKQTIHDFLEPCDTGLPEEVELPNTSHSDSSAFDALRKNANEPDQILKDAEINIPDFVTHLIRLRRLKLRSANEAHMKPSLTSRAWLNEQYSSLENGTMPVIFKCILAASGLSRHFNKFRSEFTKPEYRTRYWVWSRSFISLVDFFISEGHVKIPSNVPEMEELFQFVQQSVAKKKEGKLAPHREKLLRAIGISWKENDTDLKKRRSDQQFEQDSLADEAWEILSPHEQTKLDRENKIKKKRKRYEDTYEDLGKDTGSPQFFENQPRSLQSKAMYEWAERLIEVRRYYKIGRGYDIPASKPQLTIWMNAEIAKVCTETQIPVYTGILKAAELLDTISKVNIALPHERWGKSFVQLLDYSLIPKHVSRPSQRLMDFMSDCYYDYWYDRLSREREALLRAVDGDWEQSDLMRISLEYCSEPEKREKFFDPDSIPDRIVDVVLDAGGQYDYNVKKKKTRCSAECQQMISSMIKGIVGETTQGRSKTSDERQAEEWVWKAGSKALNSYARNWFKTANTE